MGGPGLWRYPWIGAVEAASASSGPGIKGFVEVDVSQMPTHEGACLDELEIRL
jgi:hypothetical protein